MERDYVIEGVKENMDNSDWEKDFPDKKFKSLSDKQTAYDGDYYEEDVKEFIKLISICNDINCYCDCHNNITKYAGGKLI